MTPQAEQLDRRILAFIDTDGASEPFDGLAADLFAYQYARNAVYRAYCDDLGIRPGDGGRGLQTRPVAFGASTRFVGSVPRPATTKRGPPGPREPARPPREPARPPREPARPRARSGADPPWLRIPAPWPVAWRLADLCCFDPADTVATFLSSGTTSSSGPDAATHGRSRHAFDTLEFYRAAMARPFADALLPGPPIAVHREWGPPAGLERAPILVLMPSPAESPVSSLSFMMGAAIERFGRPDASGFFVHDGRLLADEFVAAAQRAAEGGEPVVLASTAFGWVALLEALAGRPVGPLTPGSRIMETGGYKGLSAGWPRAELYRRLAATFALPVESIVSEYGMCELSSQFYATGSVTTPEPRAEARGCPAPPQDPPPRFAGPPWTRIAAIDPETQQPVPPGAPGLLRIIDLANRGSCIAVQTEDLAIALDERRFELLGRAPTAAPKGCSLTAEELL